MTADSTEDNASSVRPRLVAYDRFLEFQRQRRHLMAMARAARETPESAAVAAPSERPVDAPLANPPVQPGLSGLSADRDEVDTTSASPQA